MKAILLMVLMLCAWLSHAQKDTVYLDEVEILGAPARKYLAGTTVQKISSSSAGSLGQLGERTAIYFKEYGNGQLSTITLRGTSASHTNVLWNGLPVNSPTLGQTDFSVWPMFLIDDLSVQKGSGSSTFGSGAIGGSVLLDNSTIEKDSLLTVYSAVGSFGRWDAGAAVQWRSGQLKSETRIFGGTMQNDFPYELQGEEIRQEHAAVSRLGAAQRFNWNKGRHRLFAEAAFARNDREIQPSISGTSRDELLTENLRLIVSDEVFAGRSRHYASFGFTHDKTIFNDSSETIANQLVSNYSFETPISDKIEMRLGLMANSSWAEAQNYVKTQKRNELHLFSSLNYRPFTGVLVSANFREVLHDDHQVFAPSLGAEWMALTTETSLKLKGQVSKGYRLATFNDLYWSPGGNPHLMPETSWNYEAGFDLNHGSFLLAITGFMSDVDEWIQWLPQDGIWRPLNIREVKVRGVEATLSGKIPVGQWYISLESNYAYTHSRDLAANSDKQLPYVPRHSAFASLSMEMQQTTLSTSWNYTGERFATLSNSMQNRIDDYGLVNVSVHQKIPMEFMHLHAGLSAKNILDVEYQNLLNIAMPGRNYLFELTIKY